MRSDRHRRRLASRVAWTWWGLFVTSVASTNVIAAGDVPDGAYWVPLPDERLTALRGGFALENGLKVSFGIERAVYINGALVTTTAFNVGALDVAASGMAASDKSLADSTKSIGSIVIQNGHANLVQGVGGTNLPLAASVIQNTMNNQEIRTVTVINASVTNLQILKSLNLDAALRDVVGASIGPR